MPVNNLKEILIKRIQSINDEAFLNALKVMTDAKAEHDNYQLRPFEQDKISRAQQQYAAGETTTHEDILGEINAWIKSA